tara:strand:+ start:497 stop:1990 length:1494 start_codon:yes stop_codon:yes gene_type:complete
MRKINVRSPFFITVQKETAKVNPDDLCVKDINGDCLPVDPCIEDPTLPQCPKQIINTVFQDKNLVCTASTAQSIGVGAAVVYNFDIETTGRQNGDYTVTLSQINVPVRIRMDVLANVPKTDITTGTAFENKGLTTHSDEFEAAGYSLTGLTGTATNSLGLNITKTFAYNSSSHTGNLRFQLHLPVLTENEMTISVSCPAKDIVTTDPVTVGKVTIVSFTSLNQTNRLTNEPFRPLVKLNGTRLGDAEVLFNQQSSVTNAKTFQTRQDTIMGVGSNHFKDELFSTRRFIQAESNSGAGSSGLTCLPPLTLSSGLPSANNRFFMGLIPNRAPLGGSVAHFSSSTVNTLHSYGGNDLLSDGTNLIEVLLPTNIPAQLPTEELRFMISISKHTVKNYTGLSPHTDGAYIAPPLSSNRGLNAGAASALVLQGRMVGGLSKLTFSFDGNNNTDIVFDNTRHQCTIENPLIENLMGAGVDTTGYNEIEELNGPQSTLILQTIQL